VRRSDDDALESAERVSANSVQTFQGFLVDADCDGAQVDGEVAAFGTSLDTKWPAEGEGVVLTHGFSSFFRSS